MGVFGGVERGRYVGGWRPGGPVSTGKRGLEISYLCVCRCWRGFTLVSSFGVGRLRCDTLTQVLEVVRPIQRPPSYCGVPVVIPETHLGVDLDESRRVVRRSRRETSLFSVSGEGPNTSKRNSRWFRVSMSETLYIWTDHPDFFLGSPVYLTRGGNGRVRWKRGRPPLGVE